MPVAAKSFKASDGSANLAVGERLRPRGSDSQLSDDDFARAAATMRSASALAAALADEILLPYFS